MSKRILIAIAAVLILGVGAYLWLFQPDEARVSVEAMSGRTPQLTQPRRQTVPTMNVARAAGWPEGAMPTPAKGLRVQPFARGLDHPRWLYRLPNGDILVAETNSPPREGGGLSGWVMGWLMNRAGAAGPSANRITLLRDGDGDGVAETKTPFLTGLNSPFGMVLLRGWLYIANTDALVRVPYRDGQTRSDAVPETVVPLPGGGNHWARNVVAAPDGGSLFVSVGSASNIAENGLEKEKYRAKILEVNPDRKFFRIYAWGLRNPVGMAFEPHSKSLWTVVNERDMLGSDMPPDYLTQVDFGGFYGWPWNYWGGYVDRRVQPERPDLLQYTKRPDFSVGPHTAPLGLAFADGARLGPEWANGAFVGLHGSWNRVPAAGYKVIFVPFGDNGFPLPDAGPIDVLTGFLSADGAALGRPVGVITDATGGLLVADDVGNTIWRVSRSGGAAAVGGN